MLQFYEYLIIKCCWKSIRSFIALYRQKAESQVSDIQILKTECSSFASLL